MGHYPIKCIHCMREVAMDDRMIKLDMEDIKSKDAGLGKFNNMADVDLKDGTTLNLRSNTSKKMNYKSIRELREENKIASEANIVHIDVSPEFLKLNPAEYSREFVQSIEVENLQVNGKTVSGTVRKFYCPHCKEEITALAGKMPMYLVSIMGPSSAGKTVYLTILHMLLSGRNYNVPQGTLSFDNVGAMGKEFQSFSLNIKRRNELPATTQELKKDPYILKVSYKANPNSATSNKQCLLGLIDMRGEMLQGERNDDLMEYNVPQFKEADGFIMLVDPETLEGVYSSLPEQLFGGRRIEVLDETLRSMKTAIMECITNELGQIKRPSVVALAKTDILVKYNAQLRIPLSQPVIAPQFRMVPGTNLGNTYFTPMSMSTKACIQYLSGNFATFLENTFSNPYFVSLSALGNFVQIAGNKIDNFQKIRPVRVEEPLIHLLMDFDFIPPFYHEAFFVDPLETVKRWAQLYAENSAGIM